MNTSWETITVDHSPMNLYVIQPDGPGPFPAVVVIQNQDGVADFTQEMTRRIAEAGYIGVAPDLSHRKTPEINAHPPKRAPQSPEARDRNDVKATANILRGGPRAPTRRHGTS